ncbi:MAG: O-antigen ligase family protein [Kiritimatiellia bacterium]
MIEGIYFFGDRIRWNLGWPNPNPAGAFVALWIPLLAALHFAIASAKSPGWRALSWIVLLAEGVLLFLLCKTYSRGALLALVVALLFFHALLFYAFREPRLRRKAALFLVIRVLMLAVLLGVTGFLARIDPEFVAGDASVGNRATLWRGGMQMMTHRPMAGWGRGESGSGFMHWFQPLEETAGYAGLVNSYLHVGVERGLRILLPCLFAFWLPVAVALLLTRQPGPSRCDIHRVWVFGGAASILIFLVANIFSTLWIFERLWLPLVPVVLLIGLGFFLGGNGERLKLIARAAGIALISVVLFAGVLLGYGHRLRAQSDLEIRIEGDWLRLTSPGEKESPRQRILILADPAVLGSDWGKEVRRLALSPEMRSALIYSPISGLPDAGYRKFPFRADDLTLIVAGAVDLSDTELLRRAEKLLWLHPSGRPEDRAPEMPPIKGGLWLPMLDTRGQSPVWRSYAAGRGWERNSSGAIGNDLRPYWPELILDEFE